MIPFRTRITFKIGLMVLGSTLVILALVLDRSYTNSRDLIRQEAETAAKNLTSSLANELEQEFLEVAGAVKNFASFLEIGSWQEADLLNYIKRVVGQNHAIFGSTVAFEPFAFKPDLKRYAPYFYRDQGGLKFEQLGSQSYDYFNKEWFSVPTRLKKPVWSTPYVDEGGGNTAMTTYSHPVFRKPADGTGTKLWAVVTGDLSLAHLSEEVNAMKLYETGFCFVVSDKGVFVTARRPELVLKMTILDLAKKYDPARADEIARTMLAGDGGFVDIGAAFTGVDSFVALSPITPPGWILGAVLPKDELFAKVRVLHRETMLLAAAGLVLLLIAAVLVSRSISRPLRTMAAEAARVSEGDLEIDLSGIRSKDEVGQLAVAFTRMVEGLKDRDRIKDTFGRYLTQEVVKRLLDSKDGLKLGGESREISIMMSDLRGFTALTSTMSPEQVIKFLNRYLGKMVEIILEHGGIVDEIIGDGILAFFGAPEHLENHPELAVACALKMQIAMRDINTLNEADGLPHLEMGIAVNTGEVVVGNIGSEKRAKYGAVGSQVNFTGRAESFTVGGQLLVSKKTYERLSDKLDIRKPLKVEMKGVRGEVTLYDVRGIKGRFEAHLENRDDTMIHLSPGLEVEVFGMEQKIMRNTGKDAFITHLSLRSARMTLEDSLAQWEDVRMIPKRESEDSSGAEIYAKVTSVQRVEQRCEAEVRFTSVSSAAYKMFRRLMGPQD